MLQELMVGIVPEPSRVLIVTQVSLREPNLHIDFAAQRSRRPTWTAAGLGAPAPPRQRSAAAAPPAPPPPGGPPRPLLSVRLDFREGGGGGWGYECGFDPLDYTDTQHILSTRSYLVGMLCIMMFLGGPRGNSKQAADRPKDVGWPGPRIAP